jgi:hypothetical protein
MNPGVNIKVIIIKRRGLVESLFSNRPLSAIYVSTRIYSGE